MFRTEAALRTLSNAGYLTADRVNDHVNDGVDCRNAALIAKRSLGDDLAP